MLTYLQIGDWRPGEIDVEWVPSGRRIVPEIESLIDRAWREALARPGAHLFDGPMCRLERWAITPEGGGLHLVLSNTSYKPFFGTNMTHPELADRFGADVFANPLGVSPALETADGYLLLGRRNASVAYYPERVHSFAGAIEPRDGGDGFAAVRRELCEELSLEDREVTEVRCTALVREPALRQTEMIFRACAALTREQIVQRLGREEHRDHYAVPATESGIDSAAADSLLTPVAVASLLLWGRARFGQEWFEVRTR